MAFILGEPGIGKTTLIDAFLAGMGNWKLGSAALPSRSLNPKSQIPNPDPWVGRGQCIEHYGVGEAYLPMLEALGQLCRQPGGEQIVTLLSRYAPTWLVQMPAFVNDTELDALQRKVHGATRERMLREMAEAIEVLTAERPLVLVIEDVHWSDHSTLDLLSLLAQRRGPARLLLLATYRPADVIVSGHPLRAMKQELQVHGQCEELPLAFLTSIEVEQYLAARFPQQQFPAELGQIIHQSTEGNPLFMVNVVDEWIRQGLLTETDGQWQVTAKVEELAADVPESLRQMIEQQLTDLTAEERRVLETASVVGEEFMTATVAAGIDERRERVEAWCEGLAKREQFLRVRGTEVLADGTVTGRYGFLHALYPQVLYELLTAVRRVQLHRRIGAWGARAYGERVGEHATELARHCEQGQDYERAVQYLQQAGENAVRRSANHEAISLLSRAQRLLQILPDTTERAQQELQVCTLLGPTLMALKGYSAPEVEQTYTRALALCEQVGETPRRFAVLLGVTFFYLARGQLQAARRFGEQCFSLAHHGKRPLQLLRAHVGLANILFYQGEFILAQDHLQAGLTLYNSVQSQLPPHTLHDPGINPLSALLGWTLWCLGHPDRAIQWTEETVATAERGDRPLSQVIATVFASGLFKLCRDERTMLRYAEQGVSRATEQGFTLWAAYGRIMRGWAVGQLIDTNEGIAQIQHGLTITRSIGAELVHSWFLLMLAETCAKAGRIADGLATIAEALEGVQQREEWAFAAELYRLYGELTLQKFQVSSSEFQGEKGSKSKVENSPESRVQRPTSENTGPQVEVEQKAEECFQKAIDIARQQSAKSWELRAVMSLVRLRQRQASEHRAESTQKQVHMKVAEAHRMLSEVYNWFTEGFDTADLKEARTLLEGIGEMAKRGRSKKGKDNKSMEERGQIRNSRPQ